jgi:hypothetical protein
LTLVTAIQLAQEKNEAALAQTAASFKTEIDMHLRHFAGWCKQRGVRLCPAKPGTIAAFIRSEAAIGVPQDRILAALRSIEQMHDQAAEPNPVACSMPRAELARILKVTAPRSWPKAERPLFFSLPVEVQQIVARRAEQDSITLRRLQNKVAEALKPKENCSENKQTESE